MKGKEDCAALPIDLTNLLLANLLWQVRGGEKTRALCLVFDETLSELNLFGGLLAARFSRWVTVW